MIIKNLIKSYDGKTALNIPELSLEDGKIHAVIGANGCGKSTLAKLISGALKSDNGYLKIPSVRVGYMPQKCYAFNMSTQKNLRINGSGKNTAVRERMLMDSLKITALADKKAKKLSGGETAKMSLARLLMNDYELIILDEPTAAMDMESTLLSEKLISDYSKKFGCTVLLITHSLSQAMRIADFVYYLSDGELKEYGTVNAVFSSPKDKSTKDFLAFHTNP